MACEMRIWYHEETFEEQEVGRILKCVELRRSIVAETCIRRTEERDGWLDKMNYPGRKMKGREGEGERVGR